MKENIWPKVYIIILNYNGKKVLNNCLKSVFRLDYPNFEVVVVDNASNDGSFEKAKMNFSKVHFIQSSQNIGFARGNNLGIRWALEKMADYVWLLNNDTLIKRNTLKEMIKIAEKEKKYGVFSPLIKDKNNKIWFSGGKINWWKMKVEHNQENHLENILSQKKIISTEFITGCAMLIKKEVFRKIGILNENYFLYYEDADFSWKAHKAGFLLGIIPNSQIQHLEQSNEINEQKIYWLVKSGLYFFFQNASWYHKIYLKMYFELRKWYNSRKIRNNSSDKITPKIIQAFNDFSRNN